MSKSIIHTAQTARQLVIGSVQAIPEEWFDIQPAGFSYTIRWNIGHQATMLNWFLSTGVPLKSELPDIYNTLFMTGTKPADWSVAPPSKQELIDTLSAQLDSLSDISPDALNEQLAVPFEMGPIRLTTAGELFNFAFMHEAIHLGIISSLVKVIQNK